MSARASRSHPPKASRSQTPRSAAGLLTLALLASLGAMPSLKPLRAQAPLPAAAADIAPTVTSDMGDVGGLFFGQRPDLQKTHHYYIAAEAEAWDYAPSGRDEICGNPLPPPVVAERRNDKLRYVQYTDATFRTRVFPHPSLGVLGPVLRGVVGEWIAVTFLNRTSQPLSMHPHGVRYDKDSEGSYYRPRPGLGAAVGPGATFTYMWHLDENSGPLPTEPSSKAWLYHSHVSSDEETNLGLVGFIIVTDPARARPDGTPADVDREFGALFMIFDESGLGAKVKEAAEYANLPGAAPAPKTWTQVQELVEQGSRYAINGRIFGNLAGFEMNEGERVRWYLFGLGSENDFHTAHWHGMRVIEDGRRRTDVVDLLPATMKVADLAADNPGSWLFHCHVSEHMTGGMFARFVVYPKNVDGVNRTPAGTFLGLPAAQESLRLSRADASLRVQTGNPRDSFRLALAGSATVFEAFSVFNQTFRIQIGERSATFRPDASGVAEGPSGATLHILNAGSVGVVYGGRLDFAIELGGSEWLAELEKLGLPSAPSPGTTATVPLTLQIGAARHTATIGLRVVR